MGNNLLSEIFLILGQALFAIFGACIKWINTSHKNQQWISFLASMITAAFVGMMAYFLCESLYLNTRFGFALAGILGYQGTKGVEFVVAAVMEKLGTTGQVSTKETEEEKE